MGSVCKLSTPVSFSAKESTIIDPDENAIHGFPSIVLIYLEI